MPRKLLSLMPIVRHIGTVILNRKAVAALPRKIPDLLKPVLRYSATRNKGLYEIPTRAGAICLGEQQNPPVEASSANIQPDNKAVPRQTATGSMQIRQKNSEGRAAKGIRRNLLVMPQKQPSIMPKFGIADESPPEQPPNPKYRWHMILNNASSEVFTRMERNPYVREPTLEGISSTNYMTCRACLQAKMARSPHRRKHHNEALGEAFGTDIMGTVQLLGIPANVERYLISFIDAHSWYSYVANITKRSQAGKIIQDILSCIKRMKGKNSGV